MQKKTVAATGSVIIILGVVIGYRKLLQDMYGRFPELDKKLVRKTYNHMNLQSLAGRLDVENLDDTEMDALFRRLYTGVKIANS